jgi:WD40 repeat protein
MLWDAKSGKILKTLEEKRNGYGSLSFSPDARRIAWLSMKEEQTLTLLDAETGEGIAPLEGHKGEVVSYSFSADGRRIASCSDDHTLKLWDAKTGAELVTLKGHTERVTACCFSPDGSHIVSASADMSLRLWEPMAEPEAAVMNGHTATVHSCVFSPDGSCIVSAADDTTIRIWDSEYGKELWCLETQEGRCHSFHISPDGQFILYKGLRSLLIWEVKTGKLSCEFYHDAGFTAWSWTPISLDLAVGDGLGRFYILRPDNISPGPPVVSSWEFESKKGIPGSQTKNLGIGCPVCRLWSPVHRSNLGHLISCPNCRASLKLNPFSLQADWRLIADAPTKKRDGN